MYGLNPLDYCLALQQRKRKSLDDVVIFKQREFENKSNNMPMAEVIFYGIKQYGFMHSSQFITEAVIAATRLGLESLREYLETRMMRVDHCFPNNTQHDIDSDHLFENPAMNEYGRLKTQIWKSEKVIQDQLFDPTKPLKPMSLQYLDMPYVLSNTDQGYRFIEALADS